MAHIGRVCSNDVRGNSVETINRFVSDDLMNEYAESETFFGLPYLPGEKAEIWLCNKCGRAIFSDDGGLYVTRYMRPAEPTEFSQCDDAAKTGVFYNDKVFFDADGISDAPTRLWLLSREDMAALRHSDTSTE
mgnify:CR=1 FL=1